MVDKNQICRDYLMLSERIAEEYQDRDVTQSVQSFYLLCELISLGSVEDFIQTYGHRHIEPKVANAGKQLMNLGSLSSFEYSAAEFLNESIR